MGILRVATLLHDIARAREEETGECHAAAGARQARQILSGHDRQQVDRVVDCIATHRYRGSDEPQSLEAKILSDADKLDAIGAIGVARAYAVAGRRGQRLWSEVVPGYQDRSADRVKGDLRDKEHTPVHEYVFKLGRIRDRLFTPTAQQIARERHEYMVAFFERLAREVTGEL